MKTLETIREQAKRAEWRLLSATPKRLVRWRISHTGWVTVCVVSLSDDERGSDGKPLLPAVKYHGFTVAEIETIAKELRDLHERQEDAA